MFESKHAETDYVDFTLDSSQGAALCVRGCPRVGHPPLALSQSESCWPPAHGTRRLAKCPSPRRRCFGSKIWPSSNGATIHTTQARYKLEYDIDCDPNTSDSEDETG
eukprot:4595917-Pleurochrysis_carterae.AAC.2